ncbi:MAG: adenosylcobinamide-phosphate synthase CbiB [Syntrophomonadaceae bacterium]|nr:adenosylcobinamide-phosphate synthase CbiB [Syntrophomonadaceae bacterium]
MEMIILIAVAVDIIIGDPRWVPHPVVLIGIIISSGEKLIRGYTTTARGLKIGGALLTLGIVLGTYLLFWGLLSLAYKINAWLGLILSIYFMSQSLAVNSLYKHALAAAIPLSSGDLPQARKALSMVVGRDTENLDESEIVRGMVETVAENTVDGITAPLFYGFLGGPPLALAYKAINTLDSMIGYKDERYLDLGWAGARLDDLANYIPARLTGLIYLLIAPFTPGGLGNVWRTIKRDAGRHLSPNSGIPEAAVAGALEVQLGGVNYYRGVASLRATMGEKKRILKIKHIYQGLYIMFAVSGLMLGIGIGFSLLISS